jgi:hypothetical protein
MNTAIQIYIISWCVGSLPKFFSIRAKRFVVRLASGEIKAKRYLCPACYAYAR